jgi:hypothetical protein
MTVDETGGISDIRFRSPVDTKPGPEQGGFEWLSAYRQLVAANLSQWKLKPAMCGGKPITKRVGFDFYFHYPQ